MIPIEYQPLTLPDDRQAVATVYEVVGGGRRITVRIGVGSLIAFDSGDCADLHEAFGLFLEWIGAFKRGELVSDAKPVGSLF